MLGALSLTMAPPPCVVQVGAQLGLDPVLTPEYVSNYLGARPCRLAP